MEKKTDEVTNKWISALNEFGYEHHIKNKSECKRLKKFSRVWKKILGVTGQKEGLRVFEFGCGGGKHLVQFALNNCESWGIDCSDKVIDRAENYVEEVKKSCNCDLKVKLIKGDFLDFKTDEKFDLVFHAGVIEHFLDENERILILKKMFELVKKGGYLVSIVPSGMHPIREKMKSLKLGGYDIPEIDYTNELMVKEFKKIGAENIKILSHNIFGYFLIDVNSSTRSFFKKIFYYFFQLIPTCILPKKFAFRHTGTLIGIIKKDY